jgi:outer membrane protein assembly factor BamB
MCTALIGLLLLPSPLRGEQAGQIRVAVLSLVELNSAARQQKFSERHTESIRHQLTGRKGIQLVSTEDVGAAIRLAGIRSKTEFEDVGFLKKFAASTKADFVVTGNFSYFGTIAQNATYFDLRVYDGSSGDLAGWTFDQADRVRVATMTISSPAMEQMERMGTHLAAALTDAMKNKKHIQTGKTVLVLPFNEGGEDVYGPALARMFETNVAAAGHLRPVRLPSEPMNPAAVRKWAKSNGIEFLFEGEVVTNTDEPSVIRVTRYELKTGQIRRAEQALTSDIDLRLVVRNLARRFTEGGEHIVWQLDRFQGQPIFSTPLFAGGTLVIGVPGPAILALDPILGKEKWSFSPGALAATVGEYFHSPVLWGEAITARGPGGPTIFRRHITDEKKVLLSASYSPKSRLTTLDSYLVAEEDKIFCPTGGNEVVAFQDTGASRPEVIWTYSAFSKVGLARGKMSKHLLVYSSNGRLAALKKEDGKPVWVRNLPGRLHAAALVSGPHIFAACENGERLCLNLADGKTIWSVKQKGRSLAAPFAWDDRVCFSAEDGQLLACSISDGSKLWASKLSSSPRMALASYKALLYVPGTDGRLYCIRGDSGEPKWSVKLGSSLHCAPVIVQTDTILADPDAEPAPWTERFDHVIYVTTVDGNIFALGGNAP